MKKLTIILEHGKNKDIWGLVRSENAFTIVEVQKNNEALTASLRDQIQDYIDHEGQANEEWRELIASEIEFDYAYTVIGLFKAFDFLNITAVAKASGINTSLLRQYASGLKHPSLPTAQRIERGIHSLAQSMLKTQISHYRVTA